MTIVGSYVDSGDQVTVTFDAQVGVGTGPGTIDFSSLVEFVGGSGPGTGSRLLRQVTNVRYGSPAAGDLALLADSSGELVITGLPTAEYYFLSDGDPGLEGYNSFTGPSGGVGQFYISGPDPIPGVTWDIDWGDGVTFTGLESTGYLAGDNVSFASPHDYLAAGTYTITVTMHISTGAWAAFDVLGTGQDSLHVSINAIAGYPSSPPATIINPQILSRDVTVPVDNISGTASQLVTITGAGSGGGLSGGGGGISSYGALCSNELWNMERTAQYILNGVKPSRFNFRCGGCPGLQDLLPCVNSEVPVGQDNYQLPEIDDAPWYDVSVPESKNFAGLYITGVTMSAPYTRTSTANIGDGATLGRLKRNARTVVVTGFLVGKTCCAAEYGLRWLTSALGGSGCAGGDCDGCDFDYLACCPYTGDEDSCLTTEIDGVQTIYMRSSSDGELTRGQDFWRRLKHVGVVSGPEVLQCVGASCGCGCASLTEVTFTILAGSPYIMHIGDTIADAESLVDCAGEPCSITWLPKAEAAGLGIDCSTGCSGPAVDPLEDPNCPLPPLPPEPIVPASNCGCIPSDAKQMCFSAAPERVWGDSTLIMQVYSGASELRNLDIYVQQNPAGHDCDTFTDACTSCLSMHITYIPPDSVFELNGEERTVTITKDGVTRNAAQNITAGDGTAFDWPDIACSPVCICARYGCESTDPGATITLIRVDRDL